MMSIAAMLLRRTRASDIQATAPAAPEPKPAARKAVAKKPAAKAPANKAARRG
jgi:hypothetical protein